MAWARSFVSAVPTLVAYFTKHAAVNIVKHVLYHLNPLYDLMRRCVSEGCAVNLKSQLSS